MWCCWISTLLPGVGCASLLLGKDSNCGKLCSYSVSVSQCGCRLVMSFIMLLVCIQYTFVSRPGVEALRFCFVHCFTFVRRIFSDKLCVIFDLVKSGRGFFGCKLCFSCVNLWVLGCGRVCLGFSLGCNSYSKLTTFSSSNVFGRWGATDFFWMPEVLRVRPFVIFGSSGSPLLAKLSRWFISVWK